MSPVRTCVGCRQRATVCELLRVVVVGNALVPDPRRRMPGRGASVHRDVACVDAAVRRRAFARAFRLPRAPDPSTLRAYIANAEQTTAAEEGR